MNSSELSLPKYSTTPVMTLWIPAIQLTLWVYLNPSVPRTC